MKTTIYFISILILIASCKESKKKSVINIKQELIFEGTIDKFEEVEEIEVLNDTITNWTPLILSYEIQSFFDTIIPKEILLQKVDIEQTDKANKINIHLNYIYAHSMWEKMLMEVILYEMNKEQIYSNLKLGDKNLLFCIYFQTGDSNNRALTQINNGDNPNAFDYSMHYEEFCWYAITQMTPSDFQAYDFAFKTLYKSTKDESFNMSFYNYYHGLSNRLINDNDIRILNSLIDWTKERGEIEKPDHFEYLLHFYYDVETVDEPILIL
jgi:hypothetical protein